MLEISAFHAASGLDLLFTKDESSNFNTIKFYAESNPFGNIPCEPAYGVVASQLIHNAYYCSNHI